STLGENTGEGCFNRQASEASHLSGGFSTDQSRNQSEMGEVESTEIADFCINIKHLLGGNMNDIDLSTVPLSALTAETKGRRDEWEAAQNDLSGIGGTSAPVAMTKRTRHFSGDTMEAADVQRVAGWKKWCKGDLVMI